MSIKSAPITLCSKSYPCQRPSPKANAPRCFLRKPSQLMSLTVGVNFGETQPRPLSKVKLYTLRETLRIMERSMKKTWKSKSMRKAKKSKTKAKAKKSKRKAKKFKWKAKKSKSKNIKRSKLEKKFNLRWRTIRALKWFLRKILTRKVVKNQVMNDCIWTIFPNIPLSLIKLSKYIHTLILNSK